MRQITGVLLAAGSSARFGTNKLLVPLADGTPLAVVAARRLRAAVARCVAVVRPDDSELVFLLRAEQLQIVECARAQDGMGASLACGISACADADAWLIALADMPFVLPDTIARVAAALRAGATLAAPIFQGRRGHPVGFDRRFAPSLLALSGDRGARTLLAQYDAQLTRVACDDPGILRDVDTPADIAQRSAAD
jgi:molybdenum cofactor cytidylyltransferase